MAKRSIQDVEDENENLQDTLDRVADVLEEAGIIEPEEDDDSGN